MSNEVDTLDEEVQNTDTELEVSDDDSIESSDDSDITNSDGVDGDDESETVEEERLSKEQLDAMSDEEFTKFMEDGVVPKAKAKEEESKPLVKVISRPDPKDKVVKEVKKEDTPTAPVNYEEVYKGIFKPFKANGKEITPRTIEDVVQLMQMGANYTKKMQLMAPMKKAAESLSRAEIGEEDLNFLIDVHKGDKEAIKKLLEKHKVDPIDLDLGTTNYVPKNNIVSDEDVEYSNVLDDVRDSIPKIQEIMAKTWDAKSKEALLKDPELMRALHEEIQMNRFDKVQAQLEIEKTFGRYKGKSDVEAYIDLVTKMVANEQSKKVIPTVKSESRPVAPSKPIPDKTKAAPTRTKAMKQGTTLTAKDLFSMPESEFSKLSINDLVN